LVLNKPLGVILTYQLTNNHNKYNFKTTRTHAIVCEFLPKIGP